jgi:rhodanese-related sulfurtransferase
MSIREISPDQAKQMIEKQNAALVDVREPAEHASKHIPNARLHPVGNICASDISDHSQTLLIYCQKGMRGKKACEKLLADNPNLDVFNISGGIESWEQSGFETAQGTSKGMPLERQVQLSIGLLLLVFSILALSMSAAFTWVIALMGAALVFAGLTGFCGLARLLAIMPWNQAR